MDIQAFFSAPWHIQLHEGAAIAALVVGTVQWLGPKGTLPHRTLGTLFVVFMAITAVTAVFIRQINAGGFSALHIFVPLTLFGLFGLLVEIHRKRPGAHRRAASALYFGALIIPGVFAFLPGRLMHEVFLSAW